MKTAIRKIGNSQGVLIPKPVLLLVGLEDEAIMTIEDGALVADHSSREGWMRASQRLAEAGDDALVWPQFANAEDDRIQW